MNFDTILNKMSFIVKLIDNIESLIYMLYRLGGPLILFLMWDL